MHKNCCNQSCFFWHRYAPNRLSAGACFAPDPTGGAYSAPPYPLVGLGGGASGEREGGREGWEGEGRGGSPGMPKCKVGMPISAWHCNGFVVTAAPISRQRKNCVIRLCLKTAKEMSSVQWNDFWLSGFYCWSASDLERASSRPAGSDAKYWPFFIARLVLPW